jgi:hypothetical protein
VQTAPNLGVRYRILRSVDGAFVSADPGEPLRKGDTVRIALEPNDNGYLYVSTAERNAPVTVLFSGRVERRREYVAPAVGSVALPDSGDRIVHVVLSREPLPSPPGVGLARAVTGSVSERVDRSVYVVNQAVPASAQQVAFDITLQVR